MEEVERQRADDAHRDPQHDAPDDRDEQHAEQVDHAERDRLRHVLEREEDQRLERDDREGDGHARRRTTAGAPEASGSAPPERRPPPPDQHPSATRTSRRRACSAPAGLGTNNGPSASQSTSSASEQRVGVHRPAVVAEMRDQLLDLGLRVEDLRSDDRRVRGERVGRAEHVAQHRVVRAREVSPAARQAPAVAPRARTHRSVRRAASRRRWDCAAPASRFREDCAPARRSGGRGT